MSDEKQRQQKISKCVERIESGETPADIAKEGEYSPDIVAAALDIVVSRGSN